MNSEPVILLVEDEPDDALLAQRAFEQTGIKYRVVHVSDGEAAIRYLSGESPYEDRGEYPLPVLVILDLKMPRINGFEVLSWLQNHADLATIPVVVLTGSVHVRDREDASRLGAVGFEIKPLDYGALLGIARDIGSRWLNRPSAS